MWKMPTEWTLNSLGLFFPQCGGLGFIRLHSLNAFAPLYGSLHWVAPFWQCCLCPVSVEVLDGSRPPLWRGEGSTGVLWGSRTTRILFPATLTWDLYVYVHLIPSLHSIVAYIGWPHASSATSVLPCAVLSWAWWIRTCLSNGEEGSGLQSDKLCFEVKQVYENQFQAKTVVCCLLYNIHRLMYRATDAT